MNNITALLTTLVFLTVATTSSVTARSQLTSDSTQTIEFAKILLTRMDEINALDKANLPAAELKKLKRELRAIKGDLKELDGGTYLPLGTLVIVLLVPLMVFNISQ